MDRKTENLLYNISKELFEDGNKSSIPGDGTNDGTLEYTKADNPNFWSDAKQFLSNAGDSLDRGVQSARDYFNKSTLGSAIGLGKPQIPGEGILAKPGGHNLVLPSAQEAASGVPSNKVDPSYNPNSSYLDRGLKWIGDNPGYAALAAGAPLALAGGYMAYRKLKNRDQRK